MLAPGKATNYSLPNDRILTDTMTCFIHLPLSPSMVHPSSHTFLSRSSAHLEWRGVDDALAPGQGSGCGGLGNHRLARPCWRTHHHAFALHKVLNRLQHSSSGTRSGVSICIRFWSCRTGGTCQGRAQQVQQGLMDDVRGACRTLPLLVPCQGLVRETVGSAPTSDLPFTCTGTFA